MSKNAKILLLISCLFTLAIGFANVFVNIFLWKETNDFLIIVQYNLMHYFFIPITFIFAGWLSKKKNGILPLRLGIGFFILFFIAILFLREEVIKFVYPIGVLYGIAAGFYWLSFNVLCFDFTCTTNRDTFFGYNGFFMAISNAIAPFTASFIIEKSKALNGYTIVFSISLSLFILLIFISLILRSKNYGDELDFKKIFRCRNLEWINFRKSIMAYGIRDVIIFSVISVLIYKTTGSELSLGKLSFFSYVILSLAYILEQKIIKPKHRLFSMHLGAFFMFISVIGLVYKINYNFLLLYIIIESIFFPFFIVPINSATFNILNRCHEEHYRIEYIINKDIALNIGRIISSTILILLLKFVNSDRVLNYFLLFIGSSQFISIYFLRKIKSWKE